MTEPSSRFDTVLFDVDGTLVDSNFHHTVAWQRAFRRLGEEVPCWRIHRCIGMGGDRLVAAAAGDAVEERVGDEVREAWEQEYDALLTEPVALPGARELLDALRDRGLAVVLASSAISKHAQRAVELLDGERRTDATTTSDDAEESKPDPELLEVALERVGGRSAFLVGDSVWDVKAAERAGMPTVAVLTGGVSEAELREAGATRVYEDARAVLEDLDTVLGD